MISKVILAFQLMLMGLLLEIKRNRLICLVKREKGYNSLKICRVNQSLSTLGVRWMTLYQKFERIPMGKELGLIV